jgi:hypothetical protein
LRLASNGSVLMSDLAPDLPLEMISLFHRDGGDLLATHYRLSGNQPRMRAVSSTDPNVMAFELEDSTNLPAPAAPAQCRRQIYSARRQSSHGRLDDHGQWAKHRSQIRLPPEAVAARLKNKTDSRCEKCAT